MNVDPTTCSVCALAGSAGGMVTGYWAGRRRRRRTGGGPTGRGRGRGRRAAARWSEQGRTMRTWPGPGGRHMRRPRPPDGPDDAGTTDGSA